MARRAPQDGRFREFTQADVDVVGAGELPYHYEVELPLVMAEALGALRDIGVPEVRVLVNNRRVAEGFYRGLGIDAVDDVLRQIDKLDKVGPEKVAALLVSEAGTTPSRRRRASRSRASAGATPAWSTACGRSRPSTAWRASCWRPGSASSAR